MPPRARRAPRRAMLKFRSDESSILGFHRERELRALGAEVFRGKDGTMTVILPGIAEYFAQKDPMGGGFMIEEFFGGALWGGFYEFPDSNFYNKAGYLADRSTP